MLAISGVLIGIIATVAMDIWAMIVKNVFRLPTTNWAMVGRWFGHMRHGVFAHRPIAGADVVKNELWIGWFAHYGTGIIYGLAYLFGVQILLVRTPSLLSALVFGLATLIFPWFIMQPAMGAGVFAAKTARPMIMRLVNLSMHTVFGVFLYVGWLLIS